MADHSSIEWTDSSWPVTTGCDHVSPGCDVCFAAALTSGRLRHLPEYEGLAEPYNIRVIDDRGVEPMLVAERPVVVGYRG